MNQFIRTCDIYQRHKIEQTKPGGLLQPLPLPQQIWEDVPMKVYLYQMVNLLFLL